MPPLLLAFAPADRFAADTIRNALASAGLACDIAPQDGNARSAIVAAVAVARALLILHSRATTGDAGVLRVAEAAAGRRLPMLVVRVDDTKPGSGLRTFLRGMPSIDATAGKLPERLAGIVVRAKEAAGIALGDADAIDDGDGGIDLWSVDRRRISHAWISIGIVVLVAVAVLAWRGYDRAAAQSAYDRGVARLADGDLDAAAVNLDEAVRRRPGWAAAWRQRGFASRESAAQITNFTHAITLDAHDADSLAARGRAYLASGDAPHARADLSAALAAVPGNAEWYGERGLVAMLANDDAAAQADFRECMRIEPRCAQAFAARIAAVEATQQRTPHDWFAAAQ
ncbi:MAG: hypothetical protein ABI881_16645 [Betaproteobacteria bacterium]